MTISAPVISELEAIKRLKCVFDKYGGVIETDSPSGGSSGLWLLLMAFQTIALPPVCPYGPKCAGGPAGGFPDAQGQV